MQKLTVQTELVEAGLYTKNVVIWSPVEGKKAIENKINDIFHADDPIFLRTSDRDEELNLPRTLAKNVQDAFEWISKLPDGLGIIAQTFFQVKWSLELFFQEDMIYIEIVPGIWEMDSSILPDLFFINDSECKGFKVNKIRNVRSISDDLTPVNYYEESLGDNLICNITESILARITSLRKFNNNFPELRNLHAVSGDDFDWQFINARNREIEIDNLENVPADPVIIRNISQAEDYVQRSHGTPVVDLKIPRERSIEVVKIGQCLKKSCNELYVTTGLLSHQALVLKELGFKVYQLRYGYTPFKVGGN